jgi:ankyrin repeat protein
VKLLVEHGADVSLETDEGKNAAELAREAGHGELVDWLIG